MMEQGGNMTLYDADAAMETVELSINGDLLRQARKLGLDPGQIIIQALEDQLRAAKSKAWQEENKEAVEAYNRRIDQHGVFGEKFRRF